MRYFMQRTRCNPKEYEKFGLKKINDNEYILLSDNSIWKEKLLYDLGWGNERGYYRLPMLPFDKLIDLVFQQKIDLSAKGDDRSNYLGALAVLIEDFSEELLTYIERALLIDNKVLFNLSETLNYINSTFDVSFIAKLSDKKVKACCLKWKSIKSGLQNKNDKTY